MRALTQQQLDEIVRRLVDGLHPERIYLFGSRACGAARNGSDIDILIVVADDQARAADTYAQAEKCLEGTRLPVELVVCGRSDFERQKNWVSSLSYTVARKGRLLYAA